jgi:flagellar hook-associated protein 2
MASTAIDGLVSGLDTTSLIKSLMQVEAAPQRLLTTKKTAADSLVSALQSLNTKVASLRDAARTAAGPSSWTAVTATSSAASVTATATTTTVGARTTQTAQPGSLTFSVDAVAASQVSLSRQTPDDGSLVPAMPPAVTVKKADGTFVTVQPTTGSLEDIALAVNKAADAGVRATVVRVVTGATAEYRIQFTGTITGNDGAFSVHAGTQAEVEAAYLADPGAPTTRLDGTAVRQASNAAITLWKGGGAGVEQTVSQPSNTFSSVLTGVDLTVSKVTAAGEDPVTVTVAQDGEAITALGANLAGALTTVLSEITSRTRSTTTTADDGRLVVTGGILSGDSTVRLLQDQVTRAASMPVNGTSPSEIGLSIAKDGTFTFDRAVFDAALVQNPGKVQSVLRGLADRVATAADAAANPSTGTLSTRISGQQAVARSYGEQIDGWDRRLELRQAALEKTYAALEVQLSQLNAQSSWLTSQLASLPGSSSD